MAPKAKRRGRPPLAKEQRRSKNLTFRSRGDLHQNISRAAHDSGRSLSEEIEYRLDRSFENQRLLVDALEIGYGARLTGILLVLADAVRDVVQTGKADRESWTDSPAGYQQAVETINAVLDAFRPEGEYAGDVWDLAQGIATFGLQMLQGGRPDQGIADQKRRLLGSLLDRPKFLKMSETGEVS